MSDSSRRRRHRRRRHQSKGSIGTNGETLGEDGSNDDGQQRSNGDGQGETSTYDDSNNNGSPGDDANGGGGQKGLPLPQVMEAGAKGRDLEGGTNPSPNDQEATMNDGDQQCINGDVDNSGVGSVREGSAPPAPNNVGTNYTSPSKDRYTNNAKDGTIDVDAGVQHPSNNKSTPSAPIVIDDDVDPEPSTPLTQDNSSGRSPSSMGYDNECTPSTPTTEGVSSNANTDTEDVDNVDPSSQFDDGNDPEDDDDDIDLSALLNHGAHQAGNSSRPWRLLSPSEAK